MTKISHVCVAMVATIILCGCATTRHKDSSICTEEGIRLTSEPPGANVTIEFQTIGPNGPLGSVKTLKYTTPHTARDDSFVKRGVYSGVEIGFQYTFTVAKDGYETIVENIAGDVMKSVWHWQLKATR